MISHLKKKNTFCVDSKSFQYLVALRNNISFNDKDKKVYDKSWTNSVKESNRLITYIDTKLPVYVMKNGWQSSKHAQFEISSMIRPIFETIRNILRNRVLCKKNLSNELIELHPKPLHRTGTRCRSCKPNPQQVDKFWIIPGLGESSDFPSRVESESFCNGFESSQVESTFFPFSNFLLVFLYKSLIKCFP